MSPLRLSFFLGACALCLTRPGFSQNNPAKPRTVVSTIRLEGVVRAVNAATHELILDADSFSLPNGKTSKLDPPRGKNVVVDADTRWETALAETPLADLGSLRVGMRVAVSGPDSGSGKPLSASLVRLLENTASLPSKAVAVSPIAAPNSPTSPRVVVAPKAPAVVANQAGGWNLKDLTEGNSARWSAFASDKTQVTLEDETVRTHNGRSALKFVTASGFDTGVRLDAPAQGWDLSKSRVLRFWIWAENANEFQGPQPTVVLESVGGKIRYVPREAQLVKGGWQKFTIPLDNMTPESAWTWDIEGNPSTQNVTALEIHGDTWGFGFTWYLDGVGFGSSHSVPLAPGDLTEKNAAHWSVFARDAAFDRAKGAPQNDTNYVRSGEASLRFTPGVRGECTLQLNASATPGSDDDAYWDASDRRYISFWARSQSAGDARAPAPTVTLNSPNGQWRYTATDQLLFDRQWRQYWIPIEGDDTWKRTESGTPDLHQILGLQFMQNLGDPTFELNYDGVQICDEPQLPAAPAPPPGVDPNVIAPRVLLVVYDPILKEPAQFARKRVHEAFGWGDPVKMAQQTADDIRARTHDMVQFQLAEMVIAKGYPPLKDGLFYDDDSYVRSVQNKNSHQQNWAFDYDRFIAEFDLAKRVDAGEIDEVWVYGTVGLTAQWESCLAGRGAYWVNGPTYKAGDKTFTIMGLNCESTLANAMHSFGHRVESSLRRVYGPPVKGRPTNWDLYIQRDMDVPGQASVGTVHFPPNGRKDYQYNSQEIVNSYADDWYNYPNFKGISRPMNRDAWDFEGHDYDRGYMHFWFDHLPHFPGIGPDGYLCNWWRYAYDTDQFKYSQGNCKTAKNIPFVRIQGPITQDEPGGTVTVRADAGVDGALGRVDFYVDGKFVFADTLAPYVFDWKARGKKGDHEFVAKAYELSRGGEAVSAPVTFNVQ